MPSHDIAVAGLQRNEFPMSTSERLEAVGQRGEACVILRSEVALPNGSHQLAYTLATGERLKPAEDQDPRVFTTLDGRRQFRLRE